VHAPAVDEKRAVAQRMAAVIVDALVKILLRGNPKYCRQVAAGQLDFVTTDIRYCGNRV
jgi:hypothetical protein